MLDMNMWEEIVKRQNEDLKTDKVRDNIQVSITDKELERLKDLAYEAGFKNVGELLSSFVGDLTGQGRSNGSDERDFAGRWHERAFGRWVVYFRHYLFVHKYDLDDMKDMLEEVDYFEDVYMEYQEENGSRNIEGKETCLTLLKNIIQEGKGL